MKRRTGVHIAKVLSLAFLLIFLSPNLVYAAEVPNTLTVEEAVTKALNNNSSIKKAIMNIDKNEFLDKGSADTWTNLVANGQYTDAMLYSAMAGAMESRLNYDSSLKALQTTKEKVENDTIKLYMDVKSAENALRLSQLDYNIAQRQLAHARLSNQNGLASNSSVTMTEAQFEMKKKDIESKTIALEQAYYDFNRQVNLPLDSRYQLIDEIDYQPVGSINIDYHIAKLTEESPDLWQAEQSLKVAERSLEAAVYGENSKYRAQEITVDQTKITVADGKKSFADSIRSMYSSLLNLEGSYASLEQALKVADEEYRIAQLKFDLGLIAQIDMLNKEQAYATAENNLTKMVYSYQTAKMAFEKPWAASAGSGASQ